MRPLRPSTPPRQRRCRSGSPREIDAFVAALGGTGRVLEIGSGGGRDARELERRGLSVRCTDVAQGFVDLLRTDGFEADRLDPLTDDLADPQHPGTRYDGVWSCACLFHVARDDLVTVLGRLAAATRPGGRIHASFKEGDGEDRSTSGTSDAPRRYTDTLWHEPDLRNRVRCALDGSWTRSVDTARSRGSPCGGIDREGHDEVWVVEDEAGDVAEPPDSRPPSPGLPDHPGGGDAASPRSRNDGPTREEGATTMTTTTGIDDHGQQLPVGRRV